MPGGEIAKHTTYDPAYYEKALLDNQHMRPVWEASGSLHPTIYLSVGTLLAPTQYVYVCCAAHLQTLWTDIYHTIWVCNTHALADQCIHQQ